MRYRSELDGVRAVAVMAVFFYHCHLTLGGVKVLPGGFLGVDIFFVLSGFLISSIILSSMDAGSFSISEFYIRRAKRIIPALVGVIAISSLLTYQLLLPEEYESFGKAAVASLLFISNYYFYSLDAYTATSNLYNFLLHTWSLSAEWQFYITFPFVILLARKYCKRYTMQLLLVALIGSLLYSIHLSSSNQQLSFYSFINRAWELLSGCIVTFAIRNGVRENIDDFFKNILSVVGVALVIYSILFIDDSAAHPGIITLPVIIGTCLIILFSSKDEVIGKVLSVRFVSFIGVVSYSFYLWHQVVIVTFRYVKHENINIWQSILLLVITFIVSVISYYLIEKPFRSSYNTAKKYLSGLVFITVVLSTSYIWSSNGAPGRFGEHDLSSLVTNLNGNKLHVVNGVTCHDKSIEDSCGIGKENNGLPNVILLGDSHAGSYGFSLENKAKDKFNLVQLTSDVCLGMDNIDLYDKGILHLNCHNRSGQFSKYIEEHPSYPVIFSARLNWYLSGKQYTNEYGYSEPDLQGKQVTKNGMPLYDELLKKLNEWAKTRTIVLIYPEPELALPVPSVLANKIQSSFTISSKIKEVNDYNFYITKSKYEDRSKESVKLLDSVTGKNVIRVHPGDMLCDESKCYPYSKDKSTLYYFDDDHLSVHGADMVVSSFISKLEKEL